MSESHQKETQKRDDNSKVASELNNLIQIISGTSSLIENIWEGRPGSEKYFEMLRASIERAEQVTAQLVAQAGGTNRKRILSPNLEQHFDEVLIAGVPSQRKHSILVVDDEPMALELLHGILTDAGYEVSVAQSGFECLDLFRRDGRAYDLILTDLSMPLMDGEETFLRLREGAGKNPARRQHPATQARRRRFQRRRFGRFALSGRRRFNQNLEARSWGPPGSARLHSNRKLFR